MVPGAGKEPISIAGPIISGVTNLRRGIELRTVGRPSHGVAESAGNSTKPVSA